MPTPQVALTLPSRALPCVSKRPEACYGRAMPVPWSSLSFLMPLPPHSLPAWLTVVSL